MTDNVIRGREDSSLLTFHTVVSDSESIQFDLIDTSGFDGETGLSLFASGVIVTFVDGTTTSKRLAIFNSTFTNREIAMFISAIAHSVPAGGPLFDEIRDDK